MRIDVRSDVVYGDVVHRDQAEAYAHGAGGVPCSVVAGTVGVSRAQLQEVLVEALDQAWSSAPPRQVLAGARAARCGDETLYGLRRKDRARLGVTRSERRSPRLRSW